MYLLFDNKLSTKVGTTQPVSFRRTRDLLNKEIDKVYKHLQTNTYDTGNNNILIKAINMIAVDVESSIFEAYDKCVGSVHTVAKACGFTSSLWAGGVATKSLLYGKGYDEIVIVKDTHIDLLDFETQWMDLSCIRVVVHPITSVSVPSFLRMGEFEEKGLVVIELDLVLMLLQYRQWLKVQIDKEHDSIMTRGMFLYQVVFPKAITSHMDVMMINRFMCHFEGDIPSRFITTIPEMQLNYGDLLDKYLLNRITILTNKVLNFEAIGEHLLLISNKSAYDHMVLPRVTYTRHNEWVLNIGVLDYLGFLLAIDSEAPGDASRNEKNQLKRRLTSFMRGNGIKQYVKGELADRVIAKIDNTIKKYL